MKYSDSVMMLSKEIPLPPAIVTEVIAIIARRGGGKTYTGTLLFELMHGIGAQCVAIDPIGKWWALRLAADGKSPGLPITVFGGPQGDVPIHPGSGEQLAHIVVKRKLSCVLDISRFEPAEKKKFVTEFFRKFYRLKQDDPTPVHLFLEEASVFVPQDKEDQADPPMLAAVKLMVRHGRNYGVGMTLIDQRPQDVNKKVVSQAEVLIALQLRHELERNAILGWVQKKDVKLHNLDDELQNLDNGEAFVFSPALLKVSKRVKICAKKTYDISKTPELGEARVVRPRPLDEDEIAELRDALKEVMVKAEEGDPAALRKRIAVLERDLAAAHAARPAPAPALPPKIERVLTAEDQVALDGFLEAGRKVTDGLARVLERVGNVAAEIAPRLTDATAAISRLKAPGVVPANGARPAPRDLQQALGIGMRAVMPPPAEVYTSPRVASEEFGLDSRRPSGDRAVLAALIQAGADRNTAQLAVLTGLAPRTVQNMLLKLRGLGHVVTENDRHAATNAGIASMPDVQPLPVGVELQRYWLRHLPGGEARVLEVLIGAFPEAVRHERICEQTNLAERTVQNLLNPLRQRQLVKTQTGSSRASTTLFDGGAE